MSSSSLDSSGSIPSFPRTETRLLEESEGSSSSLRSPTQQRSHASGSRGSSASGRSPRVSTGGRHYQLQKTSAVPKSMIFTTILAAGLLIGSAVLMAHSGAFAPWVHKAAIGGTILFGSSTAISAGSMIFIGIKKHKLHRQHEQVNPQFYNAPPPRQEPERLAAPPRAVEVDSESFAVRLEAAKKMDARGREYDEDGAVYYDLTQDPAGEGRPIAGSLSLGGQGRFLKVPHLGEYETTGFTPDDHHMAVRLPASQLGAFHPSFGRYLSGVEDPQLFFMVFKNQNEAENYFHNISMHAMILDNYDHLRLNNSGILGLRKGQRTITTREQGVGLSTTMSIAMDKNSIGIDTSFEEPSALRSSVKTFHPSIHTESAESQDVHMFSTNHARFKVAEGVPISCLDVVGKTEDGHGFAFRALILNDPESVDSRNLMEAMDEDNLSDFVDAVQRKGYISREIKAKVADIFTHPDAGRA